MPDDLLWPGSRCRPLAVGNRRWVVDEDPGRVREGEGACRASRPPEQAAAEAACRCRLVADGSALMYCIVFVDGEEPGDFAAR